MIDSVCVRVQDHLNSLRNSETDVIQEDVRSAESLIKDARNSKTVRRRIRWLFVVDVHLEPPHARPCVLQLLPNLYHLGCTSREEMSSSSMGPVQDKLESVADEVTCVMDQQLQVQFKLLWTVWGSNVVWQQIYISIFLEYIYWWNGATCRRSKSRN